MPFRKKIAIFEIFFLLLVSDLAHAEDMRRVDTQQGSSVELSRIHYWNNICDRIPAVVRLVVEPKHGEVRFQKIKSTIGNFGGGRLMVGSLKGCAGMPIEAVQVVYIPNSGFTGPDELTVLGGPENKLSTKVTWRIQVLKPGTNQTQ